MKDTDMAYCMVDVYAQTGDEYIAEHKAPFALVTESSGGDVTEHWVQDGRISYGILKLLVKESGAYAFDLEHGSIGSSAVKLDLEKLAENDFDDSRPSYYAKLNANEPMFVGVCLQFSDMPAQVSSLKRVPDGAVAFD